MSFIFLCGRRLTRQDSGIPAALNHFPFSSLWHFARSAEFLYAELKSCSVAWPTSGYGSSCYPSASLLIMAAASSRPLGLLEPIAAVGHPRQEGPGGRWSFDHIHPHVWALSLNSAYAVFAQPLTEERLLLLSIFKERQHTFVELTPPWVYFKDAVTIGSAQKGKKASLSFNRASLECCLYNKSLQAGSQWYRL